MAGKIKAVGKTYVHTEGGEALAITQGITSVQLPNGQLAQVKRAFVSATSGATTELVAQVSTAAIRVLAACAIGGGTAPTVTFQSYDGSSDTAISPAFALAANGGFVLPPNAWGWFQSLAINCGIRVTVSSSSAVGVIINYIEIPDDCFDLL